MLVNAAQYIRYGLMSNKNDSGLSEARVTGALQPGRCTASPEALAAPSPLWSFRPACRYGATAVLMPMRTKPSAAFSV